MKNKVFLKKFSVVFQNDGFEKRSATQLESTLPYEKNELYLEQTTPTIYDLGIWQGGRKKVL